ncbi:unnamed protein product, partial [Coregonus sp. 'balchen']
MLGTEIDLQQVENSVVAMETVLKAWLHDQGGNKEQLHLLLPPGLQGGTTTAGQRPGPGLSQSEPSASETQSHQLNMILRPTTCWQLDWDEMESNHHLFHALCHTLRSCVSQLEEESLFNPLSLRSNLYQHLRSRGLLSPHSYPYRPQQTPRRDQPRPAEGPSSSRVRQSTHGA